MKLSTVSLINYPPVENSFNITCNIDMNPILAMVNIKLILYSSLLIWEPDSVLSCGPPKIFFKYLKS